MTLTNRSLQAEISLAYNPVTKHSSQHLPSVARGVIEHYRRLYIGPQKSVRCPYYRNPKAGTQRWGLNAFSGKGSAQEIEDELHIIQKLEGKDFSVLPEEQIRDIMRKRRIGIECSGFVAHVLDAWMWEAKRRHLFDVLSFPSRGPFARIAVLLRPFTHIDVSTLIDSRNAKEFFSWEEFRPGDLISLHDGIDHVVLVTDVDRLPAIRGGSAQVCEIRYAHSVREDEGEGIKEGRIIIHDRQKPLLGQEWKEIPDTGRTIATRTEQEKHPAMMRFFHPLFISIADKRGF